MKHSLEKKSSPLYTWKTPLRNFVVQWSGLCSFTAAAPVQSLIGELRFQKLQRVAKQTKKDASHRYGLRWLSMPATNCQKAESWMMGESPLHAPGSALLHKHRGGGQAQGQTPTVNNQRVPTPPFPPTLLPLLGFLLSICTVGTLDSCHFFF